MFGGDEDEGSIWDTEGLDLFGSTSNGVTRVLSAPDCTIDDLMRQDEFIQEAQGRNPRLLALLASREGMRTLLYYLTTPQHPRNEDRAFRFPFMACEALCCKVDELLDSVVGAGLEGTSERNDMLLSLFHLPLRALPRGSPPVICCDTNDEIAQGRPDPFQVTQGIIDGSGQRSYLVSYWSKVVGSLCKSRTGSMLRFFDDVPGLAVGMISLLSNPSMVSLMSTVISLPWASHSAIPSPSMTLSREDPPCEGLPSLLLDSLQSAISLVSGSSTSSESALAAALAQANGSASLLCTAFVSARSSAPHAKFSEDGYNERQLIAAALAAAETISKPPPNSTASGGFAAATEPPVCISLSSALNRENFSFDPESFHRPGAREGERVPLRLFKALRDDPEHASRFVSLVNSALELLESSNRAGGRDRPPYNVQVAASHVFRVLAALLEVIAVGWWEAATIVSGENEGGVPGVGGAQPPPIPLILTLLCETSAAERGVSSSSSVLHKLTRQVEDLCTQGRRAPCSSAPVSSSSSAASSGAPHPSYPDAPRLGLAGVPLVASLCHFTLCGWSQCSQACISSRVYLVLLGAVEAFPWHSIIHHAISRALCFILHQAHSLTIVKPLEGGGCFEEGKFFMGLLAPWAQETLRSSLQDLFSPSVNLPRWIVFQTLSLGWAAATTDTTTTATANRHRGVGQLKSLGAGFGGLVLGIENAILSAYANGALQNALPASSLSRFESDSEFWRAVDGPLAVANIAAGVMIGGKLPPDVKASGEVGRNADAIPAPKVREMGDKTGGEEEREEDEERLEDEKRQDRLANLFWASGSRARDEGFVEDVVEEEEEEEDDHWGFLESDERGKAAETLHDGEFDDFLPPPTVENPPTTTEDWGAF